LEIQAVGQSIGVAGYSCIAVVAVAEGLVDVKSVAEVGIADLNTVAELRFVDVDAVAAIVHLKQPVYGHMFALEFHNQAVLELDLVLHMIDEAFDSLAEVHVLRKSGAVRC
jgi:hypothetical protein